MKIIRASGNRKRFFAIALFTPMSLLLAPAYACDAPAERFCVDFYKGRNLEGKPLASGKTPYIRYNWTNRSPARKVPYDDFSARWRGQFRFEKGQYEFRTRADDGVRILLDGQPIADHWVDATGVEYRTQFIPGAGTHLVEVEYFDGTGPARVEVDWKPMSTVPALANPAPRVITDEAAKFQSLSPSVSKAPIGINLSSFGYSSASVPFKDLIMQSGSIAINKKDSNEACPQQPPLDPAGYPAYLPSGCVFRLASVFHILNDKFWPAGTTPYQSGRYVLLYKGKGQIKLSWDAKNAVRKFNGRIEFDVPSPNSGIQVEVTETDAADPVRDMHIVHINDEASFQSQPFNERWLNLLKPFSVIRFMDWGKVSETIKVYSGPALSHTADTISLPDTAPAQSGAFDNMLVTVNIDGKWPRVLVERYDGKHRTLHFKTPIDTAKSGNQPTVYIQDFLNRTWDNRAQPTGLAQNDSKGVAFETMLKLANTLGADPWINIPTAADDAFVEQLAVLIKTQLKPNLKCYIEYSNETWNTRFPGYGYAEAKAKELALGGTSPQADAWQAYRAVEIFKIFNRIFAEPDLHKARAQSRLVRILTSQTANLNRAIGVMDWQMPNNAWPTQGLPAHAFADAWAVTTYFYLNEPNTLGQSGMDELFGMQTENIDDLFGTQNSPGIIRQVLAESKARNLKLVAYEGGSHLLAPSGKPDLVAKLAAINQDQRMKDVYSHLLSQWNQLYQESGMGSIGVWNQYSDVSRYDQYGYWGLLQSTYQDPLTAPKYQAIKDYVSE